MRLSSFLLENRESILAQWDEFARSIQPGHHCMEPAELRDHGADILRAILDEMERPSTHVQRVEQARTGSQAREPSEAARLHAGERLRAGFSAEQLMAEYRALRIVVLDSWSRCNQAARSLETEDTARFNAAVDQAAGEALACYLRLRAQERELSIDMLCHDIRTPLNAISNGAQMLMHRFAGGSREAQAGARIHQSANRIQGLVEHLLDFTDMRPAPGLMNLGRLAQEVVAEVEAAHPGRSVDLRMAGELEGSWDGIRIGQLIANLACNAIVHGARELPVTMTVIGTEGHVVLLFHNYGTPIPQDELGQIFEPLRRVSRSGPQPGSRAGLGLGLYIVREVVLAHEGSVEVVSDRAKGTTFTVRLPKHRKSLESGSHASCNPE